MADQNGTATSPIDLLQQLAAFLVSNGWTQDSSVADTNGWRVHAHKGTVYVNLRAALNGTSESLFDGYYQNLAFSGLAIYLGTGYSGASNWKSQAGGPKNASAPTSTVGVGMPLMSGAITGYRFIADPTGDSIVVVVEKSAGVFAHVGWGTSLQKMGTWTGGAYFFGSAEGYYLSSSIASASPGWASSAECPGTFGSPGGNNAAAVMFVRADVDAFTGKWISIGTTTSGPFGYTGKNGSSCVPVNAVSSGSEVPSYIRFMERLTGAQTGQSLLLPIRILVSRDAGGNSFIGSIPNVFLCNACAKGFTPGALYSWGSSTYRVFPGPSTYPHHGYAVKVS